MSYVEALPQAILPAQDSLMESVTSALKEVDWDFLERDRPHSIESIHPYPAKFIGDLPRALLQSLPIADNTLVLDPFAGSGTTLVEAQKLGHRSIGIDLNPIGCLISRVKTSHYDSRLLEASKEILRRAKVEQAAKITHIPNLNHWFNADVQYAIAALKREIESFQGSLELIDCLNLALSSILVRVSNQESDTRYAAIQKAVSAYMVFDVFEKAVVKLDSALQARSWPLAPAKVYEANTLAFDASQLKDKAGIVITSPPYPNAYEYWLYHKYRMWWLGHDPIAVKEQEIGARAHFFKKNHHTEENFVDQMRITLSLVAEALHPQGYACFVVGRSKIHGRVVDNGTIIESAAKTAGLESLARISRTISSSRKSFNLSHAAIKTEEILVFQKTGAKQC